MFQARASPIPCCKTQVGRYLMKVLERRRAWRDVDCPVLQYGHWLLAAALQRDREVRGTHSFCRLRRLFQCVARICFCGRMQPGRNLWWLLLWVERLLMPCLSVGVLCAGGKLEKSKIRRDSKRARRGGLTSRINCFHQSHGRFLFLADLETREPCQSIAQLSASSSSS